MVPFPALLANTAGHNLPCSYTYEANILGLSNEIFAKYERWSKLYSLVTDRVKKYTTKNKAGSIKLFQIVN
jgi:hypothetical protein